MAEKHYIELSDLSSKRMVQDVDLGEGQFIKVSFNPHVLTVDEDRALQQAFNTDGDVVPFEYFAKTLEKVGLKAGRAAEDVGAAPMSADQIMQSMSQGVLLTIYQAFVRALRPNLQSDNS